MGTRMIFTLLMILALSAVAVAADAPAPIPRGLILPTEPHQFFGSITINGEPAPNNLIVEAYVGVGPALDGTPAGRGSATRNGGYGYSPYIMMVVPQSTGNTIYFYLVGDDGRHYELGTHPYEKFGITQLDFSISCDTCVSTTSTPSTGSGGSATGTGGGSGGSGGGLGGFTGGTGGTTSDAGSDDTAGTTDVCVPDWRCSEWTACTENVRHRVCVDRNDCGIEDDMPSQRESCGQTDEEVLTGTTVQEPAQGTFLTGLVTGASGLGALFFLVALGLFVAALVWKRKR